MDEQSIFLEALEKETPEARAAWLTEACGSNRELRARIEALIQRHGEVHSFLERPPAEYQATLVPEALGQSRADALEGGLVVAFSEDQAIVLGAAGHSVLGALGVSMEVPRVALRESAAETTDPVVRPKSKEMPRAESDSRFQLQGEIARGGMGAILKGRDTDLGRDLAIKVLLDQHKDKPQVIQRFIEEAQIGGQLQHPGIAPIYELGQFADKRPFFAMKLVKGETLSKLLADRTEPSIERSRFIGIFEQVCQTMAYAHSRGVIHRDLKPANIMVGAFGEVQVMDWGLAKVLAAGGIADESKSHQQQTGQSIIQTLRSAGSDTPGAFGTAGSHTQMGSIMGTPAYMPPEQALGEIDQLDERADVFGLGAILCEILTGKPPYVAEDGTHVFRMASRGKLQDCLERLDNCGADPELIALAKHCLELEPKDRPRSAGVLAERVSKYIESVENKLRLSETDAAVRAERLEQQQRSARKLGKMVVGLATVAAIAGFACVAALIANNNAIRLAGRADQEAEKAKQNAEKATRSQHETAAALTVVRTQKQEGEASLAKAEAAEQAARAAEEQGRRLLYTTDMRLAPFVWKDEQRSAEQLRSLLAKHELDNAAVVNNHTRSSKQPRDLRGFEWHYYRYLLDHSGAIFAGHSASVIDSALTADGRLVTLDQNGQLRRWDAISQDEDEAFRRDLRNGRNASARALSPDGQFVAVAVENSIQVLNTSTGQELFQVASAANTRCRLKFSRDSKMLVIVDDRISWFDVASARLIVSLDRKFNGGDSLGLSADGLTLAVVGHGSWGGGISIFRLDPSTGKVTPRSNDLEWTSTVGPVALSPNGDLLAVGEKFNASVIVFETDSGRLVTSHRSTHSAYISAIAFADDGLKLATADAMGTIKVWKNFRMMNPVTPASMTLKGHLAAITSLRFGSDGRQLVSTSADETVRMWDSTNSALAVQPLKGAGFAAEFSSDGQLIAASSATSLRLWDAATGQAVWQLPEDNANVVYSAAFSPTNSRMLAVGYGNEPDVSEVVLWDIDAGTVITRLPGATDLPNFRLDARTGPVSALAFSPDGKYLAAGFGSQHILSTTKEPNPVKVWDIAQRRLVRLLHGHLGHCVSLDFSHDGTLLASGSHDGTAILWSTEQWNAVQNLSNPDLEPFASQPQSARVDEVTFSPDDKMLAMASHGGSVSLWEVATGKLLDTLKGHSSAVRALAFSPDGRTLASGGSDQTVRLWNVETRSELMQLDSARVLRQSDILTFSPDGSQLLAAGNPPVVWSSAPDIWDDSDRTANRLKQLLSSNADFQSRVRMFSEHLRLYAALEKLDSKDARVAAALAATRANWHASRKEWRQAAAAFDRLKEADPIKSAGWLRTPGLLRLAMALLQERRQVDAASLLTGGSQRRIEDGLSIRLENRPVFGFSYSRTSKGLRVTGVERESPASRGNLHLGDLILKVNDVQIADQTVYGQLAGEVGKSIRLLVRHPDGNSEEVELTCEALMNDSETRALLYPLIAAVQERLDAEPRNAGLLELRAELAGQWSGHETRIADYTAAIEEVSKSTPVDGAKHLRQLYRRRAETHVALKNWRPALDDFARAITDDQADDPLSASQALAQAEAILSESERESQDYIWFEDTIPPESTVEGQAGAVWEFVTRPSPVYSGEKAVRSQTRGVSKQHFYGAQPKLQVGTGDKLFVYVYLDPLDPPQTIMLQWNDGNWNHRVFWGDDLIEYGAPGTEARLSMGPLPKAGEWVRLEVEAAKVGLRSGAALNGLAFTQYDGTCYWDCAGIVTRRPQGLRAFETPWQRLTFAYRLTKNQTAIDQLVERQPHLVEEIGDVFAEGEDWQRAIVLYSKALAANADNVALRTKRAEGYRATQQWDLAGTDWKQVIDQHPGKILQAFNVFRKAARWGEAAEFGGRLINHTPHDSNNWLAVAPVLVVAGDDATYADFCRRMVRQFSKSESIDDSHRTVKACLLRANVLDLAELPTEQFIALLENGTAPPWYLTWAWNTRALLAYRRGDAESAVKYARRSEEINQIKYSDHAHLLNLAVRAVSEQQLHHSDDARRAFDEASQLLNRMQQVPDNIGHQDLLIAQILLREFESLIDDKSQ